MSRKRYFSQCRFCLRCYYFGIWRELPPLHPEPFGLKWSYCEECAGFIAGKEEYDRQRRENRPPPQITHYDKEAT